MFVIGPKRVMQFTIPIPAYDANGFVMLVAAIQYWFGI